MSDRLDRMKQDARDFFALMFNDNGKIVEHWDALQVVPRSSKNDNGMF